MKTNIKMRVTPEQSKKVQEIVFAKGGRWIASGKNIVTKEKIYGIHIPKDLIEGMYCSIDSYNFNEETRLEEEVCADLFIRTNGTCEEQEPKYKVGDIITLKSTNKKYKIVYQEKVADEFLYKTEREKDKYMEWVYEREIDSLKKDIELIKDTPKQKTIKELENAKYKVGDILKGTSGVYENFFIKIKQVSTSETGAIYYNVKNIKNKQQYTYTERYLEQHFELKTDEDNATNPNHYTKMKIQPNEYITANYDCFSWYTANVIKYVSRYKSKNGIEDLEKAIKCLQFEIEELKKTEE